MRSLALSSQTDQSRQLSFYKFSSSYDHYEASSDKHWITSTLFLQGLNLLFIVCYSMGGLPWEIRNGNITTNEWVETRHGPKKKTEYHRM
ncbi:hypothetical protein AAG906_016554 [Vitis piasezkii]